MTARVPHPLFFDKQRTMTGEVSNVTRREVGQHVSVGWVIPDVDGLDLMVFGGPSVFTTEQLFVTTLTLALDKEVYPFDSLAFPGTVTEKRREDVLGYHAGVDMTWRFSQQDRRRRAAPLHEWQERLHANRRARLSKSKSAVCTSVAGCA